MRLFRPKYLPLWCEDRIKELYNANLEAEKRYYNKMARERAEGKIRKKTVKMYAFYVGQVTALEGVMERLFIEY